VSRGENIRLVAKRCEKNNHWWQGLRKRCAAVNARIGIENFLIKLLTTHLTHFNSLPLIMATTTIASTLSTKPSTKPLPPSPWNLVVEAKQREAAAHKAAERALYMAWVTEAYAIRTTLNDGKDKHRQVMMFKMDDEKRERVLTFQLGEVMNGEDGEKKISVSFQGVIGRLEGTQRHMSKNQRAFNRLIALRRLRDSPRSFSIDIPEVWNASAYDLVRERIRKGIFEGLV